jgi:hypothetical protein
MSSTQFESEGGYTSPTTSWLYREPGMDIYLDPASIQAPVSQSAPTQDSSTQEFSGMTAMPGSSVQPRQVTMGKTPAFTRKETYLKPNQALVSPEQQDVKRYG